MNGLANYLGAICLMLLVLQGAPAQTLAPLEESLKYEIVGLDDRPALYDAVRLSLQRARATLAEQTHHEWTGTLVVVWAEEELYEEKTGFQAENTAAAASPSQMTIWINARAWSRTPESERQRTMTHECAHILLGSLPGGQNLPLWANEGIVMHLADQFNWRDHTTLLTAHAFGQLPNLADLERGFPRGGQAQTLAYRMSYSAVGVVAENYGDRPGSVRRLVHRLADPEAGPATAREFWDEFRRDGWQLATEHSLGSRFSSLIILMSSTGAIFALITILFLVTSVIVRKRRAEQRRAWEEEKEAWEESLTDEDVQDIYGDREDRWSS